MKLPRRSRTHQLEELSIDKFKSLLPAEWVYRTPTHDYGIDGEVEVFDGEGYTTGKKFLVQLKATDEKNVDKATKLRMSIEKLNYYHQLDQPILIVRYLANSNDIYVRWFHGLNPNKDKISKKSFCMIFESNNLWNDNKLETLIGELNTYFLLNNFPLQKPVRIDAIVSADSALSSFTARFAGKLIASGESLGVFSFLISTEIPYKPIYIEFFNNEYHISLGDVASIRAEFNSPESSEDINTIVADVNVSLAILLQKLGHNSESECLFEEYLAMSNSSEKEFSLVSYLNAKVATNKVADVLDYLVDILNKGALQKDETINVIQAIMVTIIRLAKSKDESKIESTFLSLIKEAGKFDPILTSIFHYNFGNFLSGKGYNRKAIKQYFHASKLNPDYKKRYYWKRELAALFFNIGKYSYSSRLYESALAEQPSPELRGFLADSLMFGGKFKRALDQFEISLSESSESNPEWCLKFWCLEQIVNELGVETQVIGPHAGVEFIKASTQECAEQHLKNTNALCPDCWFYIATKLTEESEFDGAAVCFLLSAFADEKYKDSWMNALHCSMGVKDIGVFYHILSVVSSKFGSEGVSDFFSTLGDSNNTKLNELALQAIKAFEEIKSKGDQNRFELRLGGSQNQKVYNL